MKMIRLLAVHLFLLNGAFSQQIQQIDYCNCTDSLQQITPVLTGKYVRICNDKLIETGAFANDLKDGEWITYSKKGQLIRRFHYSFGKLDGMVELFYSDGTPKLKAAFKMGQPDGTWSYFTPKGKPWIDGTYESGRPVGSWIIRDKKGNAVLTQYDFDAGEYKKEADPAFLKNQAIVQNDNTHEYFILYYPERTYGFDTEPLGGIHFASDLFVQLMEVPMDYWDTYINYKYKLNVEVAADHVATFSITNIDNHLDAKNPIYPFIINTNRDAKIKHVQHSPLSKRLLDFKVMEALMLLPPWVNDHSIQKEIYVPYVINRILQDQ